MAWIATALREAADEPHGYSRIEVGYYVANRHIGSHADIAREDLERGRRIWERAVSEGVTDKLRGHKGACFALYHAYHETPHELAQTLTGMERLWHAPRVLEMALVDECEYYVDVLFPLVVPAERACDRLLPHEWATKWVIEYLKNAPARSIDLRQAVNRKDVLQLLPYIGDLGAELYVFCSPEAFERIRGTIGCEDHYLAYRIQRLDYDPRNYKEVAHIRDLVASGIDRTRAMGIAMDKWMHWVLLSDDERVERAERYGVDYHSAWRGRTLCDTLVHRLSVANLNPKKPSDAELVRSLRHLTAVAEPEVPY